MSSNAERSSNASKLMSFLDEVEIEIEEDVASTIASVHTEYSDDDSISIASSYKITNNNNIFNDIKQKMISLKVQLNDKTKTMELLEIALKKSHQKQEDIVKENKKDIKKQLNRQKKEFAIVTNRHLLFVDRLLNDKQKLGTECEDITNEMKKLEQECKDKIHKLQIEHKKRMKQLKQEWIVAQQIKREQWITNKTKQIKAMTIRGLEPEIERLIEQNKKDLQLKEDEYMESLRQEKENIYKIFEEKFEKFRIKLNEEKTEEIKVIKNKHLDETEALNKLKENQLNEQMIRLNEQWNEERERNKLMNEENMNKTVNCHEHEVNKLKEIHGKWIDSMNKKNEIEIKKLTQKFKIEKDEWIAIMNKKYNAEFKQKELNMIELTKKHQKDEIDVIIDKLTNEYTDKITMIQTKNDTIIDEYKNEIGEEKEKCKQWIKQIETLKDNMKNIQDQYQHKIKQIQTKDDEIENKDKEIKDLKCEMQIIKESKDKELMEINNDNTEKTEKISGLEMKYQECEDEHNEKMNRMETEHNEKMNELKNVHIMEIENIETRVRQTLCKKDDWISQLKEQIETKNIHIKQIENLLQQQRNELFQQLN